MSVGNLKSIDQCQLPSDPIPFALPLPTSLHETVVCEVASSNTRGFALIDLATCLFCNDRGDLSLCIVSLGLALDFAFGMASGIGFPNPLGDSGRSGSSPPVEVHLVPLALRPLFFNVFAILNRRSRSGPEVYEANPKGKWVSLSSFKWHAEGAQNVFFSVHAWKSALYCLLSNGISCCNLGFHVRSFDESVMNQRAA